MAKRSRTRYPVSEYGNKPRLDNFETLTPEEQNFAVGESLNWYNGVHNAQTSRKIFLDYVAKNIRKICLLLDLFLRRWFRPMVIWFRLLQTALIRPT